MHFEKYQSSAASAGAGLLSLGSVQWRWRLRADNGEIVASGEGFNSERACDHSIDLVKTTGLNTPVRTTPA